MEKMVDGRDGRHSVGINVKAHVLEELRISCASKRRILVWHRRRSGLSFCGMEE